jgi:hypothetical protein
MSSLHKNVNFNFQPLSKFVCLDSRKSVLTKSCSSYKDPLTYNSLWFHADCRKFYIHPSSLKIPPSSYSNGPLKITIQMNLVL